MINIFKKSKETGEKKEVDRTLIFYGIVFALILVLSLTSRLLKNNEKPVENTPPVNTVEKDNKIDIEEMVKVLENNNFDMELSIIADTDILNVIKRKENINKELVSVTCRDETKNYYRNNYDIYLIEEESYSLTNNVKFYNDYDDTFISITNILKLIDVSNDSLDLKEENYDIKRYKVSVEDTLKIYNNYKGLNIDKKYNGEDKVDINYKDEKLLGITLDLTSFYKNVNSDYRSIKYYFTFDNIGSADISEISNIIDKNIN